MKLLSERGKSFIDEVNSAHPGVKNPAFIDSEFFAKRDDQIKYRQITIDSLNDYYMYRHYSQYDWIGTVLKQRIIELCDEQNLNVNQLAIRAGLNPATIRSVLKTRCKTPNTSTIYFLCLGFDITLEEFFSSNLFQNLDDND